MKEGLIISDSFYCDKIKQYVSEEYILHFSLDINVLNCAIMSGTLSFIAFDIEVKGVNILQVFETVNAVYQDIPVFLISNSNISDKIKMIIERLIRRKVIDFTPFEEHFCDFINAIFCICDNFEKCIINTKDIYMTMKGKSENTNALRLFIIKAAQKDLPIVLYGQTGCGKSTAAKLIHDMSCRKRGKFVCIDIGTIPEGLIESILFGAKKGAFTGVYSETKGLIEQSDGGTLFLDEMENASLSLQAKLLNVLQTKKIREVGGSSEIKVDFRLICASNRSLKLMVKEGSFRQDLLYRINVLSFKIEKLSNRQEDIAEIARYYCKKNEFNIADSAIKKLSCQEFSGNVRHLLNILDNAFVNCASLRIIYPEDIKYFE